MRLNMVAFFHTGLQRWRFMSLRGHPFGLLSAVLNFCRFPTFCAAISRRVFGCMTISYFDDNPTLSLQVHGGWGQATASYTLRAFGGLLADDKCYPMAQQRIFLGTTVSLAVDAQASISFSVKPGLHE